MTWISLIEYAKLHNRKRAAAMSLAHRGKFPSGTIRRKNAGGRCVFIEIQQDTPWPARKWSKRAKIEVITG